MATDEDGREAYRKAKALGEQRWVELLALESALQPLHADEPSASDPDAWLRWHCVGLALAELTMLKARQAFNAASAVGEVAIPTAEDAGRLANRVERGDRRACEEVIRTFRFAPSPRTQEERTALDALAAAFVRAKTVLDGDSCYVADFAE